MNSRNGATIALVNIMREMKNRGVEVAVICQCKGGYLYDEAVSMGIKTYYDYLYPYALLYPSERLSLFNKIYWFLKELKTIVLSHRMVYRAINDFKPDIVHTNSSVIDYALSGCFLTHTPHIWHVREYIDKDFNMKIFPSMNFLRLKMKLPFNHNIAITKGVFDHFKLRKETDAVIYDGVIQDVTTSFNIRKADFPYKYFLYAGTLCEGKGVDALITQFSKFCLAHQDIHLLLACGINEESPYHQKCIRISNKCKDNIHFLGFRTDVYSLMAGSLALIVPSKFEGFGFITAEAMYNNAIVIGRNTGGTKEQFDNGLEIMGEEIGLRFDKDDDMVELMEKVLTEDFSNIKRKAHKVVIDNYTTKIHTDKLMDFYKKILCIKHG